MMRRAGAWREPWLERVLAALVVAATACGARQQPATSPARAPSAGASGGAAAGAIGDAAADARGDASASPSGEAAGEASGDVARVYDLEPMRIEVVGTDAAGEPVLEVFDARTLLDRGNDALARGRPDDALADYQRLLAQFPDSSLAPAARYNIGLALEARNEHDEALARYRTLAADAALGRDSIDAHKRLAAVLAELQRWIEAREALDALLARSDLTHSDRIEGMARAGYVAIEQKDYAAAELVLGEALDYYDELTVSLESNDFVAMCHYYMAQIPHRQFQAMPMRLPDEQLERDLDAKSKLLALAYDRYVDALQVQNAYWATAAGYQMSEIYKEFWDDIVLAPIPPQLGPDAAEYYVLEVHAEVRVLLEKAMNGHVRNVELADAYKTSTVWSDASRQRAAAIAQILARESEGEMVRPEPMAERAVPVGSSVAPGEYVPARVEL